MKTTRAFTLIEVMVVLSILALIAILAYNFFGSTMREAKVTQMATQIHKDLNVLSAALQDEVRVRSLAGTLDTISKGSFIGPYGWPIVLPAALKAPLTPPYNGFEEGCAYTTRSNYDYYWDYIDDFVGGPANETTIWMECIDPDVCLEYNKKFTSLTSIPAHTGTYPTDQAEWATISGGNGFLCYADPGGSNHIVIISEIDVKP